MEQPILKSSQPQVDALLQRLDDPKEIDSCLREVKRMLAVRQRLALESDVAC